MLLVENFLTKVRRFAATSGLSEAHIGQKCSFKPNDTRWVGVFGRLQDLKSDGKELLIWIDEGAGETKALHYQHNPEEKDQTKMSWCYYNRSYSRFIFGVLTLE